MYLEEFGFNNTNLRKILNRLQKYHGVNLDLKNSSIGELNAIYEYYLNIKNILLRESAYNSYYNHPEYTKALLICEAIRIFLSEIAPGRSGKKVRRKGKVTESILAKAMTKQLNSVKGINKLFESASAVANELNVSVSHVVSAYKTLAPVLKEYQDPDDPIYNKAMLFALNMIDNKTYTDFLKSAQVNSKDSNQLFVFLINKAKEMGLGDKARQFAYAAHTALSNADLKQFEIDKNLNKSN